MSLPFETDLTEYARQYTLQRRRYEECVQAQQNNTAQTTTIDAANQTAAKVLAEASESDQASDQAAEPMQSCVVELLEMSIEPLAWPNKQSLLQDASSEVSKPQWCDDRSPLAQQAACSRRTNPVSYGAP